MIPNGVPVPEQLDPRPAGTARLVFLGRLHPKKGIENLLEAVSMLGDLRWTLAIAGKGDPDYTASLRAKIAAVGLRIRVTMTGEVIGLDKQRSSKTPIWRFPVVHREFRLVVAEALAHCRSGDREHGDPWREVERSAAGSGSTTSPRRSPKGHPARHPHADARDGAARA